MRAAGLIAALATALVLAGTLPGRAVGEGYLDIGFRAGSDLLDSASQSAASTYFDRLSVISDVLADRPGLVLLIEQDSALRASSETLVAARLRALGDLASEVGGLDILTRFRDGLGPDLARLTVDMPDANTQNCPWQATVSIPQAAGGGSVPVALAQGATLYLPPGVHLTFVPQVDADLDASIWWRRGASEAFRNVFIARPISDPGEVVLRLAAPVEEPRARSLAPPSSARGSSDNVRPPSLPTVAECRVDIVAAE